MGCFLHVECSMGDALHGIECPGITPRNNVSALCICMILDKQHIAQVYNIYGATMLQKSFKPLR